MLLEVKQLAMRFGGVVALDNVSFGVEAHKITSLIGPNGAGKTTLFNCVTGFYQASAGEIVFYQNNQAIDVLELLGKPFIWQDFVNPRQLLRRLFFKMLGGSHRVNRLGIARTFQNIRLFRDMTAIENLLVAQHQYLNRNILSGLLHSKGYQKSEQQALEQAYYWLDLSGLGDDANKLAGQLPYGHQKRLEIIRAMCTQPQLICLDEPAAGLNPNETAELGEFIRILQQQHQITVLLIEHDMQMVMDISDKIVVLDHGEVIATGGPEAIQKNPAVLAAYLGEETTDKAKAETNND